MPIALDPSETFLFCLPSDEPKPEAERPQFECRYLTCRQVRLLRQARDAAVAASTDDEAEKRILDAVTPHLAGWKNFGRDFSRDALAETLTVVELLRLPELMVTGASLSELQKKGSASPSPSGAKASATDASKPSAA